MSHWEKSVGASDEWWTPKYIFDAIGERFDMDVAAPRDGPLHVPTSRWLSSGSLEASWKGFIWGNFPFGGRNGLAPWMSKFFDHGNGIALTPDRTSAPWFQDAWARADLVLFTPKIRFIRPDGTLGKSPSNGTALWAAGNRAQIALGRAAAAGLGILAIPCDSGSRAEHRDAQRVDPEGGRAAAPEATHRPDLLSFIGDEAA